MYSIYLISAYNDGILQWKVGLSKHPQKRLKELKTANPNIKDIHALFEISNRELAYKTEAIVKKRLNEFKINGEWFTSYSLNETLFFEYCDISYGIAKTIIQIKNNKLQNENYN